MAQQGLRAFVRGRVQGVSFRYFVIRHARTLGLVGFVRNLSNGTGVEVYVEGETSALQALLSLLRQGPPLARVDHMEEEWSSPTHYYGDFHVER